MNLNTCLLTVSDTRSLSDDPSGDWLAESIQAADHTLHARELVRDDIYTIRAVTSAWIADPEVQVIITTGGTGFTGRDSTPEALSPLFDKEINGFGELFRIGGSRPKVRLVPVRYNHGALVVWRMRPWSLLCPAAATL